MIRIFFTLSLILSLFALNAQDLIERTQLGISQPEDKSISSNNGIAKTLQEKKQTASSRSAQNYHLFAVDNKRQSLPPNVTKGVSLNLQRDVFNQIRKEANTLINLSIPVSESASFDLELFQVNIYARGFKVTTSTPVDQVIKHSGIFYNGIIKGNTNSAVAVSIFDDMVEIFIQDSEGNYKLSKNLGGDYTLYYGHDRLKKNKVACNTTGSPSREITSDPVVSSSRSSAVEEVTVYIEADFTLYTIKNRNVNTTTRFVEILMAETVALYARLDIPVRMSELKIHTSPDGYPNNDAIDDDKLSAFAEEVQDDFPGILAHLLSADAGGGIANLEVLCSTYESDGLDGPYGASGIGVPDAQTPDLDDINTFAHELGHNFGSYHTQACFWNGNNTALDGCVESEALGDEEPTCSRPNNNCPAGGGTIMSYCSTPDEPLEDCVANNNWHPQVAAYIKEKYAEASSDDCLETAEEEETTTDIDRDGFDNTEDCNDNNAQINPNQTEIAYNGIDDDCNPATLDDDLDRDGFDNTVDCNDNNAQINPNQTEIAYNGIDDDCNPATLDDDLDQDGFGRVSDCDDTNSAIFPGASEISDNGIDEDCNGQDAITVVDDTDTDTGDNDGTDNNDNDGDNNGNNNDNNDTTDPTNEEVDTPTNTGTCAAITGNLTTSSIGNNNAYIYTPQPNGAINNQFRYRPTGTDTWITTDISTNHFRYLSDLSAGTTYEFQVSQICEDGTYSEFSASTTFTTTGQAQGGGNDTNTDTTTDIGSDTPTTGTCAAITGNLTTSSIGDNNAYIYTPQPNGAINNQFRYRPIGSDTWLTTDISNNYFRYLSNLSAGTTYEFQVSQICEDGSFSEFSTSATFTTTGQAQSGGNDTTTDTNDTSTGNDSQNILCTPVTGDQLYVSSVSTSAAYAYTPQPNGATNNQFRYRAVGTTSWALRETSTLYYRYLTGLSAGTTYEFQVRQECSTDVWSSYSDSYEFTTATNSQSTDFAEPVSYATFLKLSTSNNAATISVSPNPVLSELVLHLDQAFTASSIVRVYNISGKLLKELPLEEGDSKATINVDNLQSGLYLLEYRTTSIWKTTKFIKR